MALRSFANRTIKDPSPSTSHKIGRDIRIEEIIYIDKNLDLYNKKQLASLDPKILYQSRPLNFFKFLYTSNKHHERSTSKLQWK